jgi:hypothetical protein
MINDHVGLSCVSPELARLHGKVVEFLQYLTFIVQMLHWWWWSAAVAAAASAGR